MERPWTSSFAVLLSAVLLSGCLVEETDGDGEPSPSTSGSAGHGGGSGFAPQQGTAHGSAQGIDLDVVWRACEAGFCANATARNNGTATVQVSSICESPWTDRMTHDGKAVQAHAPQFHCLAYGRKDFAPGDTAQADFSWDGKLHDSGSAQPAPEGAYTWTLAFWWDDGAGGSRQEVTADVHLIVGET